MKQIIKNYFYNSFYQLLAVIIPLITAPYLARVIGAEGVGKYSYAYSIAYYFFIFIKLGLDNYGIRTIAATRENKSKMAKDFWSLYTMQITLGIVFVALYFCYIAFLAVDKIAASLMLLYVLSGLFDITWFFNGIEKFKLTVTRNTIVKVLTTVMIFVFVKDSSDIYLYIFIMALSFLVSQLLIWPFVKQEISFVKVNISDVIIHIKPNAALFIAVLAISLYRYMDKIMLGSIINEYEVGIFENAEKIMQIPVNFVNALGIVMIPRMTNMISRKGNNNQVKDTILICEVFVIFLSSSLCLGIMGISDTLIPVFYGPGFERCIDLLKILMPSCLFMAFANVIRTQFLIPMKKDNIYIKTIIGGAVINLAINSILIPQMGADGAAIGTLAAEVTVCFLQSWLVRKDLPILKFIVYSFPFLVAGVLMVIVLNFVPQLFNSGIVNVIAQVFIGVIIYLIIAAVLLLIFKGKYLALIGSVKTESN